MTLGRRTFLKAFGALPAAPLAAKEALAQTGIRSLGLGSVVGAVGPMSQPSSLGGDDTEAKAASWLLANGVPAFVRDAIRRDYRVPNGLDPDLVANRSFSLTAKVHMQRERDIKRRLAEVSERQKTTLQRLALRKACGFDFWW